MCLQIIIINLPVFVGRLEVASTYNYNGRNNKTNYKRTHFMPRCWPIIYSTITTLWGAERSMRDPHIISTHLGSNTCLTALRKCTDTRESAWLPNIRRQCPTGSSSLSDLDVIGRASRAVHKGEMFVLNICNSAVRLMSIYTRKKHSINWLNFYICD